MDLVAGMREAGELDGCEMEEKTEWSSVNLTASSTAGEKEGCDTCKQMKHRNDGNRSAGMSLDCCSSKLLEFNHVWVWAVTAGCNTPVCHHRSPLGPGSVQGLPQPNSCRLITDHPLNVKCFAVSATISDYLWEYLSPIRPVETFWWKQKWLLMCWSHGKPTPPPPKKNNKKQWKIKVWEQYCTESYKTPRLCPQW